MWQEKVLPLQVRVDMQIDSNKEIINKKQTELKIINEKQVELGRWRTMLVKTIDKKQIELGDEG